MPAVRVLAALSLSVALGDCTGPTDDGVGPDDSGPVEADTDTGTPADDPSAACTTLGLPVRPFADVDETTALNGDAADFTVETTAGDWTLSAHWSGCDSYLFIQDEPQQAKGWPTALWDRDVAELFDTLPDNVEVFFVSTLGSETKRTTALDTLQADVDDALARSSEEDVAWWTPRVHYVTTRDTDIEGWIGTLMGTPGWGVGIDRFQHIRYIGSYADPERYAEDYGWFEPNLSMAANEPIYYNFEADRAAAMDAENATVVPVIVGQVGGSVTGEATLPDAAAMAGFDTLTVDTRMGCGGVGEYGYCPAWDYMAYLYLSVEALPEDNPYASTTCQPGDTLTGACHVSGGTIPDGTYTCNDAGTGYDGIVCPTEIEVGRWITTYHREGRWVYDISAMLPFLQDGGAHTFRYETNGPYTIDVSLRLSNQGKASVPAETTFAFDGGEYDQPFSFDVPADATKVELATVISQHGSDSEYCGEFCDIAHHFTVNGNAADEVVHDFPEAGTGYQCQADTAIGTVPNQYGTWWYGRGGWCPGKEVPTVMSDITDQVTIGATNTIEYTRTREGSTYTGGANVRLASWIVVSR
jgi:hypothetical protein